MASHRAYVPGTRILKVISMSLSETDRDIPHASGKSLRTVVVFSSAKKAPR
jgi:hypothetical protein